MREWRVGPYNWLLFYVFNSKWRNEWGAVCVCACGRVWVRGFARRIAQRTALIRLWTDSNGKKRTNGQRRRRRRRRWVQCWGTRYILADIIISVWAKETQNVLGPTRNREGVAAQRHTGPTHKGFCLRLIRNTRRLWIVVGALASKRKGPPPQKGYT